MLKNHIIYVSSLIMSEEYNDLRWDLESLQDQLTELHADKIMEREVMHDITMKLRQELKDAYKHISVLEDHMENLLQKVYTLEIENDK